MFYKAQHFFFLSVSFHFLTVVLGIVWFFSGKGKLWKQIFQIAYSLVSVQSGPFFSMLGANRIVTLGSLGKQTRIWGW